MDQETWLKPESQTQTGAPKSIKLPSHLENSGTETWLCKKWKRVGDNCRLVRLQPCLHFVSS